jgi:hypothetical protein
MRFRDILYKLLHWGVALASQSTVTLRIHLRPRQGSCVSRERNVARVDRNFLHTRKAALPLMQQQNGSQPRFCTTQSHRSLEIGSTEEAQAGSWAVYDL